MRVFVTGGTGLLGNNVIRMLRDRGDDVTAVVRNQPEDEVFAGLDIEVRQGKLDDVAFVRDAVAGHDAVIHSAGLIHIGRKRRQESFRVNEGLSATIARACRELRCKMVHVGTVNTMAIGTPDRPSDEEMAHDGLAGQIDSSYVASKKAGIAAVMDEVGRGLNAAIVHPGFMLGPYDWKPSSGRMMVEVQKAWRPLAPAGGCSVCDVRDVAAGTIAAIDRDVPAGREFILAGENWTYLKLWTEMARRVGRRPPLKKVGPVPRWIGGLYGDLVSRFGEHEHDLNSTGIAMSSQFHFHDSQRARRELGYTNRPVETTLDDAAEWLRRFFR